MIFVAVTLYAMMLLALKVRRHFQMARYNRLRWERVRKQALRRSPTPTPTLPT